MIKLYSEIIGTPVMHFEEGALLAIVKEVIIDPDTGKMEALWVKPVGQLLSYAVIQTQDVAEWKKNLYIKDVSAIGNPAEVIRIAEILSANRLIIGNKAYTEAGDYLGKVSDIDFDTDQYYLRHLYVQKTLLGFFGYDRRVLSYDSIIEVLQDRIIIKDTSKKEVKIKKPLIEKQMLLDN